MTPSIETQLAELHNPFSGEDKDTQEGVEQSSFFDFPPLPPPGAEGHPSSALFGELEEMVSLSPPQTQTQTGAVDGGGVRLRVTGVPCDHDDVDMTELVAPYTDVLEARVFVACNHLPGTGTSSDSTSPHQTTLHRLPCFPSSCPCSSINNFSCFILVYP